MGAINNAFNQAVGALAGSALAVKHAQESEFTKMNAADISALTARNQAREADTAAKEAENKANNEGLNEQYSNALLTKERAEKAVDQVIHRKHVSNKK